MIRDLTAPILSLDGEPVKQGDKELTMHEVVTTALLMGDPQNKDGAAKAKRFFVAQAVHANPAEVELSAEQMADIKKLVGESYGPLVVGQVYRALDGDAS